MEVVTFDDSAGGDSSRFQQVIAERPLRRALLMSSTSAVLLACPGVRLFVWLGKNCSDKAYRAAEAEALRLGKGAQTQVLRPCLLRGCALEGVRLFWRTVEA